MAKDNKIQMPGVFGGLMKYDEEYKSRIVLSPATVVGYVILIIVLVVAVKIFWPIVV